jgi:hypothetical protein
MTMGGGKGGKKSKGKEAKAEAKGQLKRARRLESALAEAATSELKQLRKFEKARLRRQRIEAEIDGVQPPAAPAAASPAETTAPKA